MRSLRIAYVNLHWSRPLTSGVGKKMDMQLRLWREMGHTAQLFMHMHTPASVEPLVAGEQFEYAIKGRLGTEIGRSQALMRLMAAVRAWRPDVIYLRYGMYVFPLQELSKIAPVVVEINTNDVHEHERLGGVLSLYNRLTRGITLRSASGFVAVSGEFLESPNFARYHKKGIVVGNGIDLSEFDELKAPGNDPPRVVFVGTPGFPWNGIDHLVKLAEKCQDLEFDLVGYDQLPDGLPCPPNIHLLGYLSGASYKVALGTADAALGPFALYRIQVNERSTLKLNEYLACGLPVITAYRDTNLEGLEADWLLRIPNAPDNIETHAEAIRNFVYAMRGRRVDRAVVAPRIDARIKERERLAFLDSIVKS